MRIGDKLQEFGREAQEKFNDVIEDIKREATDGGKIDGALDSIKEKLTEAKDFVGDKIEEARAKAEDLQDDVADKVEDVRDDVEDKVEDVQDDVEAKVTGSHQTINEEGLGVDPESGEPPQAIG